MMPTQDGWEILQALKNDPATQHVPVIICSVLDDPELARSLGAVAYLHKPVTQADLLSVLTTLSRDSAYRP
jgi:CheY-like chemotaxis protein